MHYLGNHKKYAKQIREAKTTEEAEAVVRDIINGIYEKGYNDGADVGYKVGYNDGYKMCEWDSDY